MRTIFITCSLGYPNLACQRLALLEEVTSKFKTILEVLLTVAVEVGNSAFGTDVEVDISREGLPWSWGCEKNIGHQHQPLLVGEFYRSPKISQDTNKGETQRKQLSLAN